MDPVRDRPAAVATGDRWIEDTWSKGKAAAEAAAIPGHREFFDIVEQRYPNPYRSQDPQEKVGDLWLTQKGKGYVAGGRLRCLSTLGAAGGCNMSQGQPLQRALASRGSLTLQLLPAGQRLLCMQL